MYFTIFMNEARGEENKVKIALDASCLVLNPSSGLAEVARNLVDHLPLVTQHHSYSLFMNYFRKSAATAVPSSFDEETNILRMPRRIVDWWWRRNWPSLDMYVRGVDVFHGLHIQVPPTRKIRTVLTVHDCRYLALPTLYPEEEVKTYREQMTRSLRRADQIGADSEFTRQELLSYFSLPEERVKVIHNGFRPWTPHTAHWEKKVQQFLEEQMIPQPYLLYLGVLDPRKNILNLIEALARCKEKRRDFPDLLLVGIVRDQWMNSKEARRARELRVFDCIHIAGVLEKDLAWGLTKKSLALCYPSLYEGFGFPPLEAMSVGVPVLAGRSSSIPEVTGDAACLVDPFNVEEMAEGLNRIVSDSSYRHILTQAGYQRVKFFSWKKTVEQYISLYHEAANS
ncbi:MAG: glycosyl transferase family 1 [Nitrospirales bacterium]|nr:MAG: glycosyl transferase family 1 [Nitrospirales bacterium]